MKSAEALAGSKDELLAMKHISSVLEVTEEFEHDLKGTRHLEGAYLYHIVRILLTDGRYDELRLADEFTGASLQKETLFLPELVSLWAMIVFRAFVIWLERRCLGLTIKSVCICCGLENS